MLRRSFLQALSGTALLAAGHGWASAQDAPLRMAVHPYNSTLALIGTHRPLQQYLERTLQRPIEFYTAPSFAAFVQSLLNGEYDIVISPPHFAVLALEKGGYAPLAHYQTRLDPLLVVRKETAFQRAADFAGKRVAMADELALIRIVVVKWLADAGLVAGKHYQIVERPTHSASISAAAMGEADAGLATSTAFRQVPADVREKMRTVPTGYVFPHLFTLAHQRVGTQTVARLRTALLNLTDADPDGKAFLEKSGIGGYDEITKEDIAQLKPYLEPTRRLVGQLSSAPR